MLFAIIKVKKFANLGIAYLYILFLYKLHVRCIRDKNHLHNHSSIALENMAFEVNSTAQSYRIKVNIFYNWSMYNR
jgi:hypothetical protein